MSDYFSRRRPGSEDVPDTSLDRRVPTTPNYTGAMGAFGSLSSFARRRAASRYTREIEALDHAVAAAVQLNRTREQYARTLARLTPDNLEKMALEEQARVDAELAEIELRRAEAVRRQHTFEKKTLIEDENLEAELLEAKLRKKRAEEALYGKSSIDEPSPAGKRNDLEDKLETAFRRLQELDADYIQRTERNAVDEAYENVYNMKRNRLMEEIDRLTSALDAL